MNVKLLTAEQFKNEKCYTPDEVAVIVTKVLANNPSLETLFGRPRPDAAKQKESILKELYEHYVMTTVTTATNQTAVPVAGEPEVTVTNE